jgi:hypothetical protein
MKYLTYFIIFYFILLTVLSAHHNPMISKNYPPAPPTIDPGPDAALLRVSIVDKQSGQRVSATACVNNGNQEPDVDPYRRFSLRESANRHKGPIRFRKLDYYFYTNGIFEIRVPPGQVSLYISKGYEYKPQTIELTVNKKEVRQVKIELERAIDMASMGWYSGDTHIHMERTVSNADTLLTITSAKDIRYAYLLSMNTEGYGQGDQYESWLQANGLGDESNYSNGIYYISSGQEYRTNTLGHLTLIMNNSYVPGLGTVAHTDSGPSLAVIADQAHDLGGFAVLNHGGYPDQEGDRVLLEDKMDFLELLQFGGYRSLGLDGWYDYLNIGFRLPIAGACDFPYTRELGSEISYVWSDRRPTPRTFAEGLRDGKSFATSGPMIFLKVDDKLPGDILSFDDNESREFPVSITVKSPIYPVRFLELIVNGKVIERLFSENLRTNWQFNRTLNLDKSTWIAARTYAEAGTEAHTNPVYIYFNNQLPMNRKSLYQIIIRLENSMETIPNPRIVAHLYELKLELQKILHGERSNLPFPPIP